MGNRYASIVLHHGEGLEFQLSERVVEMEYNLVLKRIRNRGLQRLYSLPTGQKVTLASYAHTRRVRTRKLSED